MTCNDKNTRNLSDILAEIEDQAACNGYSDLLYKSAKIYLKDINGLSVRIDLPDEFFVDEDTPPDKSKKPKKPPKPIKPKRQP
jgi:hypothetical protein